jgi:uncharacterized membrane protein
MVFRMETTYRVVLAIHVAAGVLGLLAMLPPLLAKKGARLHRRVGWVFVAGMGTVSLSGTFLAAQWLLSPALFRPGVSAAQARVDAIFLLSIAALTSNAIIQAVTALRRKRHPAPRHDKLVLAALGVLVSSGLLAIVVGAMAQHTLSIVFGAGSLALATQDARFTLRPLASRHAYLYQHINAIGTACISAVTAFLVLGGQRLFPFESFGSSAWLFWIGPGAVGGPLFQLWIVHYRRKLEGQPAAPERAAATA